MRMMTRMMTNSETPRRVFVVDLILIAVTAGLYDQRRPVPLKA